MCRMDYAQKIREDIKLMESLFSCSYEMFRNLSNICLHVLFYKMSVHLCYVMLFMIFSPIFYVFSLYDFPFYDDVMVKI